MEVIEHIVERAVHHVVRGVSVRDTMQHDPPKMSMLRKRYIIPARLRGRVLVVDTPLVMSFKAARPVAEIERAKRDRQVGHKVRTRSVVGDLDADLIEFP